MKYLPAALLVWGAMFAPAGASAEAPPQGQAATAPESIASPPAAHYYRSSELDVRPGIMTRVEPEYPEGAARRGLSGTVVLQLYIGENGAVDRVETLRARPAGVFERAAERAFRAARFTPAMKDRRPVKTQMTIEVRFDSPPPERPAGWR